MTEYYPDSVKMAGCCRLTVKNIDASTDLLSSYFYSESIFKSASIAKAPALLIMISSKKALKIILADDDEDDRTLFKEVINDLNENIEVIMFENGDELLTAVTYPGATVPDFIFLDLNMPRKNGHECLKEIRKLDNLSEVPVVIYSTSMSGEQIDKTYNAGANLYIQKPTSFKALRQIAENVFTLNWNKYLPRPKKENFIWSSDSVKPKTEKLKN